MSYDFKVKSVYTFNTIAPGILQSTFKNARLTAELDYESAMLYENVNQKFRQIYPLLPPGTPDRPESATYYRFVTESGEKVILADLWIDSGSVISVTSIDFQVTFTNASIADMSRIRDMLNAMGYTNYNIVQIP